MKIQIYLDANEKFTGIGLVKALIEARLSLQELRSISKHLEVYCDERIEQGGE